jgi:DNA-binding response OmpR family regulator
LRRILLIDDTPEIAELLSFSLRDAGYEVFPSGYTVSVNELIREHQADALVLDCTSFDAVRHSSDHAEFPVAIISDTPELADASLRARKAQKVLLIPKPFTGSQVATALSQLLG